MSGLHYSHKLPWSSLSEFYKTNKHPAIILPVGECKRIHIVNNRVKHQVKNATFLQDDVCSSSDCTTVGKSEFRKSSKLYNELFVDKKNYTGLIL
jgi:hypothetical protein